MQVKRSNTDRVFFLNESENYLDRLKGYYMITASITNSNSRPVTRYFDDYKKNNASLFDYTILGTPKTTLYLKHHQPTIIRECNSNNSFYKILFHGTNTLSLSVSCLNDFYYE